MDFDEVLSKYSNAPDIYSKIIAFRKQAKNMDPDERASVEKAIAEYSNALNKAKPVRKTTELGEIARTIVPPNPFAS